jgi:putative transposase
MRRVQNVLHEQFSVSFEHGGELRKGQRKIRRPLATKKPMLVTFRSSLATGVFSFHRYRAFIHQTISTLAARFGVKVYRYSINTNHIHMVIKGGSRNGLQNFLRTLPALIARKITGAKKNNPFGKRFWDLLVHSRIVSWGKAFRYALDYVLKNQLETEGLIPYSPRKKRKLQPGTS